MDVHEPGPESPNPHLARLACVGGALAGALLWGSIAYFTRFEIGFVAVGIGALIGWLCVQAGGRGPSMAMTAAVFALVSILAGKYLAFHWSVAGEFSNPVWHEIYDETKRDATAFAALGDSPSDEAIEAFMIEYGFDDHDLEGFRDNQIERLRAFAEESPGFDQWSEAMHATFLDSVTLSEVYIPEQPQDMLLDLVFLAIGVSAAFGLVSRKTSEEAAQTVGREQWETAQTTRKAAPTATDSGIDAPSDAPSDKS